MDRTGNQHNHHQAGRRRTTSGVQHLDLATVTAFVDGMLSPLERERVAAHLATCAACQVEVNEIRTTVELLHGLPEYRQRRTFRLDQTVARRERGNIIWLGRYLPALPAVRVATAAVALLFLTTIAADMLIEPDATVQRQFADEQAPETAGEDEIMSAVTATLAPDAVRSAPAPSNGQAAEAAGDDADEAAPVAAESDSPADAAFAPVPTATPILTPTPIATTGSDEPAAGVISSFPWRVTEIALGLLLLLLLTVWLTLQRLKRGLRVHS